MQRRQFLLGVAAIGTNPGAGIGAQTSAPKPGFRRVRPRDAAWPSAAAWAQLQRQLQGRLIRLRSPFTACSARLPACGPIMEQLREQLRNPYYLRDTASLTQAMGWADAWESTASAYAVACETAQDVAAAVNFARQHRLRLVVKGGGHSYQGTSCAPDSLLIWMRNMDQVVIHDSYPATDTDGQPVQVPAVSIGAGAIWMHVYDAVTSGAGRYVQGGGCATVGVAGLIQSGGFGSHSKRYGLAAASLLEAEVVSADGVIRTVDANREPELFWALRGGGGGSFGVVTRVTLRTHELPDFFGVAQIEIRASSADAYQRLIAYLLGYYAQHLCNPHWGEQMVFKTDNSVAIQMSFQGLDKTQAEAIWQPCLDWLAQAPADYQLRRPAWIATLPARMMWNPKVLRSLPGVVKSDSRPGAPEGNIFWPSGEKEAGKYITAYHSAWLPATLLAPEQQAALAAALFASTRHWEMALHFNKGLAGAPPEAIRAAQDTATNPLVLDAFALAICAAEQSRVHPRMSGFQPDLIAAHADARAIERAMQALLTPVAQRGSYVSESNYFEKDWQQVFWGKHYQRLLRAKQRYDPDGLFFVHHGVGSEAWSADGFTRSA